MPRVFAVSDIHVDLWENSSVVKGWSHDVYGEDTLILAGDVTDDILLLEKTLKHLKSVFATVYFVPGNHDLWVRSRSEIDDKVTSISKLHSIQSLCEKIGVLTGPEKIDISPENHIWIVPLMSWYSKPDDFPDDSLHMPAACPEDERMSEEMWMDNYLCVFPQHDGFRKSEYFAKLNEGILKEYDGPVISFSHFLPRSDLVHFSQEDLDNLREWRKTNDIPYPKPEIIEKMKKFNFSRFAGSKLIEKQIRHLGSIIHVYGHQHRNKDVDKDGVRYVSHCLGYAKERTAGAVVGMLGSSSETCQPKQIWP
ncbi:hypothetical protein ScPMuIL_000195 [Solemya velum]